MKYVTLHPIRHLPLPLVKPVIYIHMGGDWVYVSYTGGFFLLK